LYIDRSKKADSIVSSPKIAGLSPSYKIPKKGRPKTWAQAESAPEGEEHPPDAAMSSGDDEPLLSVPQRKRAHSPTNKKQEPWEAHVTDRPRSTPVAKKKLVFYRIPLSSQHYPIHFKKSF